MPSPARRNALLDGVRGIAIVLVVLSHGWALWPITEVLANDWTRPWFTSGNFAVSIFFVVGAFLATREMLRRADADTDLHLGVAFVRRYLRLSGQLYVLLLAVLVVTAVDEASSYPDTDTAESVWRIVTYTWNWFLVDHPLEARPDLGHLWYLSVDLQVFVLLLVLVYLLSRHRAWLCVALSGLLVGALLWRDHVYATEGAYNALVHTTVRMDAPLAGALAAVALPYLGRVVRDWRPLLVISAVSLVPVLVLTSTEDGFLSPRGALIDLTLAVFVVASVLGPIPPIAARILGSPPLTYLGRRSLGLYLWHYPAFWWLSRHSADWAWELRTVVGLLLAVLLAEASERIVEVRMQRWLQSPAWRELDAGIAPYFRRRLRHWWQGESRPQESDRPF